MAKPFEDLDSCLSNPKNFYFFIWFTPNFYESEYWVIKPKNQIHIINSK